MEAPQAHLDVLFAPQVHMRRQLVKSVLQTPTPLVAPLLAQLVHLAQLLSLHHLAVVHLHQPALALLTHPSISLDLKQRAYQPLQVSSTRMV